MDLLYRIKHNAYADGHLTHARDYEFQYLWYAYEDNYSFFTKISKA